MGRLTILIYGLLAYAVGTAGLTYFALFVGGWSFLPRHIDSRQPGDVARALLINVGLIALFGLQHSVMARAGFKQHFTRLVPKAAERSTYVLLSGILMCAICFFWQAMPGDVWRVDNRIVAIALIVVQLLGWTMAVTATWLINHFELFGLQQIYYHFIHKPEPAPEFTERFLYKIVRHPLQLGLLLGMWSTPEMSATHLALSITMTIYIVIGLRYEEQDLIATPGQDYADYRRRVPMILPIGRRGND